MPARGLCPSPHGRSFPWNYSQLYVVILKITPALSTLKFLTSWRWMSLQTGEPAAHCGLLGGLWFGLDCLVPLWHSCSDQHRTLTWSDTWLVKNKRIFTGESLYSPGHPVIMTKDIMQLWWKLSALISLVWIWCRGNHFGVWNSLFPFRQSCGLQHTTQALSCRPKGADTSNRHLKSTFLIIILL